MNWSDFASHLPITDPTWIFFLVLLIILFAPLIMGKFRIPHIVGMILAGMLVGKYGLNLLNFDDSFELFGKVGMFVSLKSKIQNLLLAIKCINSALPNKPAIAGFALVTSLLFLLFSASTLAQ